MRYAVYGVLYAVWALAVVHSYRQYRKDRAVESVEAAAVIAETNNIVADVTSVEASAPAPSPVSAGRPSAPRD